MRGRDERSTGGTSQWVRSAVVGLGLALGLTAISAAQEQPKGGLGEGIKVHGHWTIEVRNQDGSLASHTEFENKLADSTGAYPGAGNVVLASILGRNTSVGLWEVQLHGVNIELCFNPTPPPGTLSHGCIITEPGATNVGPNYFRNLTVTSDLQGGTVTLQGSARRGLDERAAPLGLSHVVTAQRTCAGDVAPSTPCTTAQAGGNFTETAVVPNISIAQGQTIDVKVVLSFS